MMDAWEEDYEVFAEDSVARENAKSGMLTAHLTVLLAKQKIVYQTPVDEIQQALMSKFDVEYDTMDISTELTVMLHNEERSNAHACMPEQF